MKYVFRNPSDRLRALAGTLDDMGWGEDDHLGEVDLETFAQALEATGFTWCPAGEIRGVADAAAAYEAGATLSEMAQALRESGWRWHDALTEIANAKFASRQVPGKVIPNQGVAITFPAGPMRPWTVVRAELARNTQLGDNDGRTDELRAELKGIRLARQIETAVESAPPQLREDLVRTVISEMRRIFLPAD